MGKLQKIMINYFMLEEREKKEDTFYLSHMDLLNMHILSLIAKMKEKK